MDELDKTWMKRPWPTLRYMGVTLRKAAEETPFKAASLRAETGSQYLQTKK